MSICVKDSITIPYSTEAESLIINARVPYDQEAMDIYNKFKADLETDFGPLNTFPFSMLASLPFSMLASLPFSIWNKEIVHGFTAAIAEYERCSRLQYEKQAKV